jgi:hypothetical protein
MNICVNTNNETADKEDMMLETILDEWGKEVKEKVGGFSQELKTHCEFRALEGVLGGMVRELVNTLLQSVLEDAFSDESFLGTLKHFGASLGIKFKGYREVSVYVYTGSRIRVKSPYFVATGKKRGRKRRGPNGRGKHLGLEVFGFIERGSGLFVSEVVKLGLLCPSFEVAREVLSERGIVLNVKTIRRFCRVLGQSGLEARGEVSFEAREQIAGHTLVIGVDGGRVRERTPKRGKKKQGQKRQGYYTDWREPKLLTVYVQDAQGKMVKTFAPLHDATLGNDEAVFALLETYLRAVDLTLIARIVFTGDGAPWIWTQVEHGISRLGLSPERVFQVIDYAHATQNLYELVELAGPRHRPRLFRTWKALLFKGDIQGIGRAIRRVFSGTKLNQGLKKWKSYFQKHARRMQYEFFRNQALPCGSGHVESAIRRVINLRLKAPGTFWTRDMAECFLFLRSQLLSGRWKLFMKNVSRKFARLLNPNLAFG